MAAGAIVLGALKLVGSWVISNPDVIIGTVDKIAKFQADKKSVNKEEHFEIIDEKLNQLGVATLELDQKIDTEMDLIRKQLHTMKIMLSVMGSVLIVAVIAIILLAIF